MDRPNARCSCGSGKKHKKCCGGVIVRYEPENADAPKKVSPALLGLAALAVMAVRRWGA
jgi:hypothetical protein